ncbi:NADH-quinone oxidoreductase subunit L [Flavipsychrobacter stenotrophus]|uniref:NADH-quinone oxidoreductase subunit L n=1 Tax=Flavipsychrobacter stenotrophus TaxID=2077091 RepID=A0A2S7SU49_9BACT|nr:NADH-quinone oxidoreductase subunit L [Flavipsychrobacter stenotrophus]PQJ10440.1 NADH-quinone oxidoreductase subunit L [Flavipsychrobacter stenotrophus]
MGNFSQLVYLVPLFPLVGFLINGLLWNKMPKSLAGIIGSAAILASFCVSLGIFFEVKSASFHEPVIVTLFDFIQSGKLHIPLAFQVDQLSSLFLLIITGVGFLIHVYSASYMSHDEGMVKYFAYLNLFVFSMLLLILGANYLVMFIGWEGVGLCSYLLIGFWFKKREYTNAAKKAFVMNRIGDLGFLVGMLLVLYNFGTLSYKEFFATLGTSGATMPPATITAITICFFIGATGKSAQIPLYTWLPDAMAGPTPVSALIHAATMVTAGIYMIARSHVLYSLAPFTLNIIAIVGLATALLAATIAIFQYDIKKVLAYSTVSQLGFMFLAIGSGAYTIAVFHVMTHAFFKALMFLGSGSVIHAMGGEQDIRKMGGLGKKMKITSVTFLIGCLAISGFPLLSGFFSKDAILTAAYAHNPILYALGVLAAMMTAFYMFRLYVLTFRGTFRGTHEQEHHLHESPAAMTIPLIVLAILSVIGGYVGIPEVFTHKELAFNEYLGPVVKNFGIHEIPENTEIMLMTVSTLASLAMMYFAMMKFRKPAFPESTGIAKVLENKWYVDELYDAIIVRPIEAMSGVLDRFVEKMGIDGIVNGVGKTVKWGGDRLRMLQTGQVGFYIFIMVIGMVALFTLSFFWIR